MGTIHASVWDLSSDETLPEGVEPESVDIVILVFVLSALHPDEWGKAITNVHKVGSTLSRLQQLFMKVELLSDLEAWWTCRLPGLWST